MGTVSNQAQFAEIGYFFGVLFRYDYHGQFYDLSSDANNI